MPSRKPPSNSSMDLRTAARVQLSVILAERERRQQKEDAQEGSDTSEPARAVPIGRRMRALPKKVAVQSSQAYTEHDRREYIRLIRDGHAERVEATIRSVSREIEIGRKTDRFSDAAARLTEEFEQTGQEFIRKRQLLARVEERLGPLRSLVGQQPKAEQIQETVGHDRSVAEKVARLVQDTAGLRDELIDMACRLLQLWDRIDEQVLADEKEEERLRARISQYLENFPAKERLQFEVRLERSLRGARLQQRLHALQKFERVLADSAPEGRERRKDKLLAEGQAQLRVGDFGRAIEILERVYRLDRTDEAVVLDLAKAYMEQHEPERAIGVLREILQWGESVSALLALASCLEKIGQVDEALKVYARAIQVRPKDLQVRVAYCEALARFGRMDEALEHLVDLHARQPGAPDVALALAKTCVLGGQLRKAREVLVQLTEADPECIDGWTQLADLYWEARQLDDAQHAYRRLVQLSADNFQGLIRLADLERQRGDFQEAEEHYRAAEKLDSDSWLVHIGLGIVLRETGQLTEAVSELERAVALNPDEAEAYHHLGLACLLAGDSVRAATALQQAVSFGFSDR